MTPTNTTTSSCRDVNDDSPAVKRPPSDLFPLPLTELETLMFVDDLAGYPKIFKVTIELNGELLREPFEDAVRAVIRRNPMLSAIVQTRGFRPEWILIPFPDSQIVWQSEPVHRETIAIDLRKTPGFCISAWTNGKTSEVQMTFHHATCDGMGCRRFLLDFLTLYARSVTPDVKVHKLDSLDYERLRKRGDVRIASPAVSKLSAESKPMGIIDKLKTVWEYVSQQPATVRFGPASARVSTFGKLQHQPAHQLSHQFKPIDVTRFQDALSGSRITLNDVAIAILLNCIARWNRMHGETGRDRLYRILVPVDLRTTRDWFLPSANRLSFVFITRPTSLCLDFPRLLPTMRDEMDFIARHGCESLLVQALSIVRKVPGLLPFGVRLPYCIATAVLSYLGDNFRGLQSRFPMNDGHPVAGNVEIIRAGGAPPLRPRTRVALGLSMTSGELLIRSQFDARYFELSDCEQFAQMYIDTWRSWSTSPNIPI